jgi:hypothetical protein
MFIKLSLGEGRKFIIISEVVFEKILPLMEKMSPKFSRLFLIYLKLFLKTV